MTNIFPSLNLIEYVQHPVVFHTEYMHYPDVARTMYKNKSGIEVNSKEFKQHWAKEKIKHRDANAVRLLGNILDITENYVCIANNKIEPDPEKIKALRPYELEMLGACINCMNAVERPDRHTDFSKVVKKSLDVARKNISNFTQYGF